MKIFLKRNNCVAVFFGVLYYLFTEVASDSFHNDLKWQAFKCQYNKTYPSVRKEVEAYKNFNVNKRDIAIQNEKYARNESLYLCGLNENSDYDAKTWLKLTAGFKLAPIPHAIDNNCFDETNHRRHHRSKRAAPASVDYHKSGLTTPVKNQGACGSGYSFAVAAAIEGQAIKNLEIRTDLSNQQILDCSGQNTIYGNFGCDGGFPDAAFDYVRDNGGLAAFSDYPYTGQVGFCYRVQPVVTFRGHKRYVQNSAYQLKQILASTGPVVVAMDASHKSLNDYKKGIYTEPLCRNTRMDQLDHVVTLVGYGEENGVKFWKIKNSWGSSWGEQGYVRINADYDCGVKLDVYTPA